MIIDRLLKMRSWFLEQNKPVPEFLRLKKDKIGQLGKETLQFCSSGIVSEIEVLGMKIIEK